MTRRGADRRQEATVRPAEAARGRYRGPGGDAGGGASGCRAAAFALCGALALLAAGCAGRAKAATPAGPAPAAWPAAALLPADWRPLDAGEVAAAFPHRSPTAETLVAAGSRDGRFLAVVAADRKPSLVAFARREGPAGLRDALDAYLPRTVPAFRLVDAVEGQVTGRPALAYRFTGLAAGVRPGEEPRFALELIVVPTETALYTVSLLDLSGAGRFADPAVLAFKAALRGLFEAAGRPADGTGRGGQPPHPASRQAREGM